MSAAHFLASGNAAMIGGALLGALEISDVARRGQKPFLIGAGYPITPVNEVVDWGNRHFRRLGADFIQAESEIAAANMVIGAATLGTPAFTATSSPGMSLMQEALSFAVAMELGGLVFANISRGGPGLGSIQGSQADLLQAIGGTHGDAPRLVLAPSSVQEMFDLTRLAFAISAQHRLPAMILADGHLAQMTERFTFDGTLREAEPLQKPRGVQTSLFVDENALAMHNQILAQRFQALADDDRLAEVAVEFHHADEAEILIVAYGVFARCARGIVERARAQGLAVGLMTLKCLSPFPMSVLWEAAEKKRALFVLEGSHGQLHGHVRQACGYELPIGLGAYPGGVLPEEHEVVDLLKDLFVDLPPISKRRTIDYSIATPPPPTANPNPHEMDRQHMRRGRKPAAEIMSDIHPPHCPGCGEPVAIEAVGRVLREVATLRPVIFSPVGCAVFTGDLFDPERVDAIQVPHGRGPAAASAAKRANPTRPTVVIQGDGDALNIGGNELLHVIERGDPITLVILNNGLYGMTGGQASSTAPSERPDRCGAPLDLFTLTDHPGVAYFRRLIADDHDGIARLEDALRSALAHQMSGNGLSIVEVLTACPTHHAQLCDVSARQYVRNTLAQIFPTDRMRGEDFENAGTVLQSATPDQPTPTPNRFETLLDFFNTEMVLPQGELLQPIRDLSIFLFGRGGQGIQTLARILHESLINAFTSSTLLPWYGPEVRGGVTNAKLRFSAVPHLNPDIPNGEADLFLCLDPSGFEHKRHLIREPGGLVVFDSGLCPNAPTGDFESIGIPAAEISQRECGSKRYVGMILLGHALQHLNLFPIELLRAPIHRLCSEPDVNWKALTAALA